MSYDELSMATYELRESVYPLRADSRQFRIFTRGGALAAATIVKWEMDAANPW